MTGRARVLIVSLTSFLMALPLAAAGKKPAAKKPAAKKPAASKPAAARPAAKSISKTPVKPAKKTTRAKPRRRVIPPAPTVETVQLRRRDRGWWSTSSFALSTAGDELNGEDLVVRQAAVEALGPLNGTVVVTDPTSGRILSIVNQRLALSDGETPCSTIKMPVALAGLAEGLITRDTRLKVSRRLSLTLTEAMARSNNEYFERLGRQIGFEKWRQYVSEFGFGEKAGYQIAGEQVQPLPTTPARYGGLGRMSSFGTDLSITPLQMSAFVSAVGNGGTLYYLQYPRTPEEVQNLRPLVKRQLNVSGFVNDLREGMFAAVDYGTGRRAANPFDAVYGKTGTCSNDGAHLGWFASYAGSQDARLSVVVLLRGGRLVGGTVAAEVAGKVYRGLHERSYFAMNPQSRPAVAASDSGNGGHE
jgi:beta-lactamase class D